MSSRTLTLICSLAFLAACTDEPVAPDAGFIEAVKGGKPGKPDGGADPGVTITETNLGTLGGIHHWARSVVSGLDGNSVRVVGESGDRAFYWTGGVIVELTTGPVEPNASILETKAVDINDGGQIVGSRWVDRGDLDLNGSQPLFWSSSQAEEAIVLPMELARGSYATAINNGGQIVGQLFDHLDDPDHGHAMLWTVNADGTVTTRDLHEETFKKLGFIDSHATDINDRGQVVGHGWTGTRTHGFLWDNGVVTFLGSYASAINNAVQIVGHGASNEPVVWTVSSGSIRIDVIPPLPGFDRAQVYEADITDDGKIAGFSVQDGPLGSEPNATLWTINTDGTIDRWT